LNDLLIDFAVDSSFRTTLSEFR